MGYKEDIFEEVSAVKRFFCRITVELPSWIDCSKALSVFDVPRVL